MKREFRLMLALACLALISASVLADKLHTPAKSRPERKAILDVLRENFRKYNVDGNQVVELSIT
jgi:hypothetical protein